MSHSHPIVWSSLVLIGLFGKLKEKPVIDEVEKEKRLTIKQRVKGG